MKKLATVVLAVAACGPAAKPPESPEKPEKPESTSPALSKDDAVFTALFLHEIKAGALSSDETACLAIRGREASDDAVLRAVQATVPTAVDNSECTGGGPDGPVLDKNGGKAARFDIGPITWMGETAAISGGGAHRGGGAREMNYKLELKGGTWTVIEEKPGMMM